MDKITARIKTFEVDVAKTYKFGVLDIFVERCVFSKPIFKPESLAYIRIKDNSDRLSEVKFKGWMFASSPALNALENSVYDISILACKKVDKQSKKSYREINKLSISLFIDVSVLLIVAHELMTLGKALFKVILKGLFFTIRRRLFDI